MLSVHYIYNVGHYMFSQLYMQTILCGKNDSTNLKKKKKRNQNTHLSLEKSQNYQTSP